MLLLENISETLQKGKSKDVALLVQEVIDNGIAAQDILDKGLLKVMGELGVKSFVCLHYLPQP